MAKVSPPKVVKTIFQVIFQPSLSYFSVFREAMAKLQRYPHWTTDSNTVTVRDYEKRCSVSLESRAFSFSQNSDDLKNDELRLKEVMEVLPSQLGLREFIR